MRQLHHFLSFVALLLFCSHGVLAQNAPIKVIASLDGGPKYPIHQVPSTRTIIVDDLHNIKLGDFSDGHFVVYDSGAKKMTIFDDKGEKTGEINAILFWSVPAFSEGVALIYPSYDECVLVDYEGTEIVRLSDKYKGTVGDLTRHPEKIVDGLAVVEYDLRKYHFIDTKGNVVAPKLDVHIDCISSSGSGPISPRSLHFNRRAFKDEKTGLYGYIDKQGTIIIPASFSNALDYSDGAAAVMVKNNGYEKWGFIDTNGKYIIEPVYSNKPSDFHEGYATINKKNGKVVYINKKGDIVSDEYDFGGWFIDGHCVVNHPTSGSTLVVLNRDFKPVKELQYAFRLGLGAGSLKYKGYLSGIDMIYNGIEGGAFSPMLEWLYTKTGPFFGNITYYDTYNTISRTGEKGYINRQGEIVVRFVESQF